MATRPEDVPAGLRRQLDLIRADASLSAHARKIRIARAYLEAKNEQARLLAAAGEEKAARKRTLERRLFGAQAPLTADDGTRSTIEAGYRDALARASQAATEVERRELLCRAELVGDDALARAVAAVAFANAEHEVVNIWLETRPHLDGYANELWTQTHETGSFTADAGWHLRHGLERPGELADTGGDYGISILASQDEKAQVPA